MDLSPTIFANFLSVVVLPVPALASIIKSQSWLNAEITFSNKFTFEVYQGYS